MDASCYIMLSALQHYAFCPRQCALIHLEMVWMDNAATVEGASMHAQAHSGQQRMRDGVRVVSALPLQCTALGITGVADIVEFHQQGKSWQPYPVEYKRGHPQKSTDADRVQLCAQALCLEEMLHTQIISGALYYGLTHHRVEVTFDDVLRTRTREVAQAVHDLFASRRMPPPLKYPCSLCNTCSLQEICIPKAVGGVSASSYLKKLIETA